jgi:hypothetical protein
MNSPSCYTLFASLKSGGRIPLEELDTCLVEVKEDFMDSSKRSLEDNPWIAMALVHLAAREGEFIDTSQWQPTEHYTAMIIELDEVLTQERDFTSLEKALFSIMIDDLEGYVESNSSTSVIVDHDGNNYYSYCDALKAMLIPMTEQ